MSNEAAGADLVTTELEAVIYEREGPLANHLESTGDGERAIVGDGARCRGVSR